MVAERLRRQLANVVLSFRGEKLARGAEVQERTGPAFVFGEDRRREYVAEHLRWRVPEQETLSVRPTPPLAPRPDAQLRRHLNRRFEKRLISFSCDLIN